MSFTTWNAAGLFGSALSPQVRNIAKFNRLQRLLSRGDIIGIQEAHGCEGDLNTFHMECPSHMHWGTFGARAAIGGITTSISHPPAAHFDEFEEFVPMVARCHGIR